jgi:hypothetical protein
MTREEALACVPVKRKEVREERLPSGALRLTYPVRARPWMTSIIRRLGGPTDGTVEKKLELDALGTSVWQLLENRSVKSVIQRFAREHNLHPREAEVSITAFLRELGRRGIIGMK